ncbi:MAG: DNA translocase FtsK 4TM domain-containing protein [Chloroflexi bacterium]|nr:DNA translocase FtsK 4TM domain-containing protein [Chloroflexota bacterium]
MAGRATKQSKSRSRPKTTGESTPQFVLSRRFLGAVLVALALAVFLFLRDVIGEAIFAAFGLGFIIVIIWGLVLAWMFFRNKLGKIKRKWHKWLGALLISASLLGVMGLYHPSISIAGASLEDKTLGGVVGDSIAGPSFVWARLLGIVLVGMILFFPVRSLKLTKKTSRSFWQKVRPQIIDFSDGFRSKISNAGPWLSSKVPFLNHQVKTRSPQKTPKSALKKPIAISDEPAPTGTQQILPGFGEAATRETDDQSPMEEVFLPSIDRELPPLEILDEAPQSSFAQANDEERARLIEDALGSYGVEVKVLQINPGPSVTQFGVEPGWVRKYKKIVEKDQNGKPLLDKNGNPKFHMEEVSKTRVKVDRITALANDLALALAVSDIRIEAPVPGKALVGIEVPNVSTATVTLRNVIESPVFPKIANKSRLAVALGQGAGGEAVVGDLAKMPHLLIAGATGSGKTVCLNCIVSCLLSQTSPVDVRLVLIDPKRVEMVTFSGVPHLITPVIVDVDKAVEALRRVAMEMDRRYRAFADVGARNIETYNRSPKVSEPLSYIVVIIDELADLMMTAPDVAEPLICRIAQLARATGIHLVVATQRPSVDVITGLIKANFPTRISFAVVSGIDSRTILDTMGAEKLLGRGDMLYIPPEASKPRRIRGCFVSDDEMDRIVKFWKEWAVKHFPPENDRVAQDFIALSIQQIDADPFMQKARELYHESSSFSISLLQRKLHIGYQRAARIMEQLEEEGLFEEEGDEDEFRNPWEGEL